MSAPAGHVHVSERELAHVWPDGQKDDGRWEDCLWCSTVEWLNDTWKNVPDTHAYAELLRDASGEPPTGGSNFGNVRDAFAKLSIPVVVDPKLFTTFWNRLAPGTAGVANGAMGNFVAGHNLRRWDPGFTGGHSVYVARMDAADRVWWCDPLAPKGTYNGQWVTKTQLKTFMGSTWTGVTRRLLSAEPPVAGADMPDLTTYMPGATANVKASSNIRSAPRIVPETKLRTTTVKEPVVLTGTVKGDVDPINGSDVWYMWYDKRPDHDGWAYTAKDNIVDLKPSGDDGYTKATQDAAVAAANAACEASLTELRAVISTQKGQLDQAAAHEAAAVKTVEDDIIRRLGIPHG